MFLENNLTLTLNLYRNTNITQDENEIEKRLNPRSNSGP